MILNNWKTIGCVVSILMVISVVTFIKIRLDNLERENKFLLNENTLLNEEINTVYEEVDHYSKVIVKHNDEVEKVEYEKHELEKTLAKHDLNNLMNEKPSMIIERVNKATERLFKEFNDL